MNYELLIAPAEDVTMPSDIPPAPLQRGNLLFCNDCKNFHCRIPIACKAKVPILVPPPRPSKREGD